MAVKYLSTSNNDAKTISNPPIAPWVRNPGWLTLPNVTGQQKFVGLYRIDEESNFASLRATVSSGNYIVDWGDGIVETIASNTQANHIYDYTTYDTSGTTLVTHNGVTYKQAIITVTPETSNLTVLNLALRYPISTTFGSYDTGWLDIAINAPNLTVLSISDSGISTGTTLMIHASLERVAIYDSAITSLGYMFARCYGLKSIPVLTVGSLVNTQYAFSECVDLVEVPLFNTASVTNMQYMFNKCYNLKTIPLLNTANVTSMQYMFQNCYSLETIPLLNTVNVLAGTNIFVGCSSLKSVPALNFASLGDMSQMFTGCWNLEEVGLLNTANATNMYYMFSSCYNLKSIPLLNTANVTNMQNMFQGCYRLKTIPQFNMSKVTTTANMFQTCYSLLTIPSLNMPLCTTTSTMFQACLSLISVGDINMPVSVTSTSMFSNCNNLKSIGTLTTPATGTTSTFGSMFQNCAALSAIPSINLGTASASTSYASIFDACRAIVKINAYGAKWTHTLATCGKLGKAALESYFLNLGGGVGQTITITPNYGNDTPVTKTMTTTAGSRTVTGTDTSNLAVGMYVVGTNTGASTVASAQASIVLNLIQPTDSLTTPTEGQRLAFGAINSVTGINLRTIYYAVNCTPSAFQVSLTPGGTPITLGGTASSVGFFFPHKIDAITPNVSILLDKSATGGGGVSLTFSKLDITSATFKGWTVTR